MIIKNIMSDKGEVQTNKTFIRREGKKKAIMNLLLELCETVDVVTRVETPRLSGLVSISIRGNRLGQVRLVLIIGFRVADGNDQERDGCLSQRIHRTNPR